MNKRIISLSLGLLLLSGQMGLLASAQSGNDTGNNVRQYKDEMYTLGRALRNHYGVTPDQIKDYNWSQTSAGYKLQYYSKSAIKYTAVGLNVLSAGDLLWRIYKNPKQREALTERFMTSTMPRLMVAILGLYGF